MPLHIGNVPDGRVMQTLQANPGGMPKQAHAPDWVASSALEPSPCGDWPCGEVGSCEKLACFGGGPFSMDGSFGRSTCALAGFRISFTCSVGSTLACIVWSSSSKALADACKAAHISDRTQIW